MYLKKKYVIKIPDYVTIFYCNNSNILVVRGLKRQVVFKLNIIIKLLTINTINSLFITKYSYNCVYKKKSLNHIEEL